MKDVTQAIRYYYTARHLRPIQIWGRIWFKLTKPAPDLNSTPSFRDLVNPWVLPAKRQHSLVGAKTFYFLNETKSLKEASDWNNPDWKKLWLYNLHYFDDLNAHDAVNRTGWHKNLIPSWINENPPGLGNGWEPYPLSLRIVNWVKWALAGNKLESSWVHNLAIQVRYLTGRLERHLLGNHLIANAKALVFAGLFFGDKEGDSWLTTGLSLLDRELEEQILSDGGHFERSPMYHCIILEDLLDVINLFNSYGRAIPASWTDYVGRMRVWLQTMCHPDGQISLFNDSALHIAPHPSELELYAERLYLQKTAECQNELAKLLPSGYLRWQQQHVTALLDVAPLGPDYLPAHGHADTLGFELSLWGQRVFVDSGTSCYESGHDRTWQRSTSAHNTVEIDGECSSDVWGSFRVGKRAKPFDLQTKKLENGLEVVCAHDGYLHRKRKAVHRRHWIFLPDGLIIRDNVQGDYESAVGRFYFHPDVKVDIDGEHGCIVLPEGQSVKWKCKGGNPRLIKSSYHPEMGLSLPNKCIEILFVNDSCEFGFDW